MTLCQRLVFAGFIAVLPVSSGSALAADGEITVTFLASPTRLPTEPGHAFICVSIGSRAGPREECFGFYPKDPVKIFDGPGKVERELSRREKPERFSTVAESLTIKIDEAARQRIYEEIKKWEGRNYDILANNCGDMMFAVASASGLPLPDRRQFMRPTEFVSGLKAAREEAQKKVEAERAQEKIEAEKARRQVESAQRTIEQIEQGRKQQEQLEAAKKVLEQVETLPRKAAEEAA